MPNLLFADALTFKDQINSDTGDDKELNIASDKEKYKNAGMVLLFIGGVSVAGGALIKFGTETTYVYASGYHGDESTYNVANYGLMIGGGIMMIVGTVLLIKSSKMPETGSLGFIDYKDETCLVGFNIDF